MARTRSGQDLCNDAYRRADLELDIDRHPRTDVLRYVNQGCAALYDLLVAARGPAFYSVKPAYTITTAAQTTRYALPAGFYRLTGVRLDGDAGYTLSPFQTQDEPMLRATGGAGPSQNPTHYQLQPGFVEILPKHAGGQSIIIDYIPVCPDLTDDPSSLFDGINGWEEFIVIYAAKCMLFKDGEWDAVNNCTKDLGAIGVRVAGLAPTRDAFRAERVRNVRGLGIRNRGFY